MPLAISDTTKVHWATPAQILSSPSLIHLLINSMQMLHHGRNQLTMRQLTKLDLSIFLAYLSLLFIRIAIKYPVCKWWEEYRIDEVKQCSFTKPEMERIQFS